MNKKEVGGGSKGGLMKEKIRLSSQNRKEEGNERNGGLVEVMERNMTEAQ